MRFFRIHPHMVYSCLLRIKYFCTRAHRRTVHTDTSCSFLGQWLKSIHSLSPISIVRIYARLVYVAAKWSKHKCYQINLSVSSWQNNLLNIISIPQRNVHTFDVKIKYDSILRRLNIDPCRFEKYCNRSTKNRKVEKRRQNFLSKD